MLACLIRSFTKTKLVVTTLNMRGIWQAVKRTVVFQSLRSIPFNVLLVHEVHWRLGADAGWYMTDWTDEPSVWVCVGGSGRWGGDFEVGPGVVVVPGWVLSVDDAWRGIPFRFVCVYAPAWVGEGGLLLHFGAPAVH